MQQIQQRCVEAYRQHQNLKVAAQHVGIPWQTVYAHLRSAGEPVTGNKAVYGSDKDKLAAAGESLFALMVPFSENQNAKKFQSKIDFLVRGYGVDVKTSTPRIGHKGQSVERWAFSMKKQEMTADFVACLCMNKDRTLNKCLLIPGEIIRHYQSISVSVRGGTKWHDYEVGAEELAQFFNSLPSRT
ncbi:hypothetical protein [Kerstersia similis]|uniref:hypothetical protein n=1 Tax=Kerstersia similis TaxID=206505 RepID=UPI0039EF880C